MKFQPSTIEEVQTNQREVKGLLPRGGGTKPGLSAALDGVEVIEMGGLAGMLEYQPEEYIFTALAGTRLSDVSAILGKFGQFLPFDPPFEKRGATLGGTVAAGLSGPGRYHFGGVRDFLMGVRFVDRLGRLVGGGGKVVKNAAGFDLPKLMVGGLGKYGVLVELSFKVFPRPSVFATVRRSFPDLGQALKGMKQAALSRVDLDALDLQPGGEGYLVWARVGGPGKTLPPRLERLKAALNGGEILMDETEPFYWQEGREFDWVPPSWALVKLPITPGKIQEIENGLPRNQCMRRYSAGGQVAWISMEGSPAVLGELLSRMHLNALVIWGPPGMQQLGEIKGQGFYDRIRMAMEEEQKPVEA